MRVSRRAGSCRRRRRRTATARSVGSTLDRRRKRGAREALVDVDVHEGDAVLVRAHDRRASRRAPGRSRARCRARGSRTAPRPASRRRRRRRATPCAAGTRACGCRSGSRRAHRPWSATRHAARLLARDGATAVAGSFMVKSVVSPENLACPFQMPAWPKVASVRYTPRPFGSPSVSSRIGVGPSSAPRGPEPHLDRWPAHVLDAVVGAALEHEREALRLGRRVEVGRERDRHVFGDAAAARRAPASGQQRPARRASAGARRPQERSARRVRSAVGRSARGHVPYPASS